VKGLFIFLMTMTMSVLPIMAEDIPEDWGDYQDLPVSVLCGYVEIKLHEDVNELIYVLSLAADKLSQDKSIPEGERAELIQRAWHLTRQVSAIFNDESPDKNQKNPGLMKLRLTRSKLMEEAKRRTIVLDGADELGGQALQKPPNQPPRNLELGDQIVDPALIARYRTTLLDIIKKLETNDFRAYSRMTTPFPIPDDDPQWGRAEKRFFELKGRSRQRFQHALNNEKEWRLYEKSRVFNCVIGPDEKSEAIIVLEIHPRKGSDNEYYFHFVAK
jgi:hypothetical protein